MKKILLSVLAVAAVVGCTAPKAEFKYDREIARSVKSVAEASDGSVTFSIYAPMADTVALTGDLAARDQVFTRSPEGIWSVKVTGVEPGSYRYGFNVDGLNVVDPLYPKSGDVLTMTDLTFGKGDQFWSVKDVTHGAMSQIYYHSKTTGQTRRMHVWTPAGYMKSTDKLPVFYLLHGGGDIDSGWPVIGCAGAILDNLLAEGKIVPMVVVMPDISLPMDKFSSELITDIMPCIESNVRVKTGAANSALAGLSMGGINILNLILEYPDRFKYINVMSAGFMARTDEQKAEMEKKLAAVAPRFKSAVSFLRFTMGGPADAAYPMWEFTLPMFDKAGIPYEKSEIPGGHNWYVWRFDLHYFAQKLFK